MMKLNKAKINVGKDYKSPEKNNLDVGTISNRPNGITLIALVITIVVLIILAGVAINLTLGENGIFNKAKQAREQYKMAEVKEKVELAILDIQSEKLSKNEQCTIDTLLTELPIKLPGLTISKEGDNLKGSYNDCTFIINPEFKVTVDGYNPSTGGSGNSGGNTPINPPTPTTYSVTFNGTNVTSNGANSVNENATYTATLTAENGYKISSVTVTMGGTTLAENTGYTYSSGNLSIPNVSGNIEIVATATEITISDLKAGDYIKYDTGKTEIGENGIVLCRVLYEASSQYGLQIITDKNIKQKIDGEDTEIKVELGGSDWATGKVSYNSAIETLNNEAEKYLNTAYATDARCVGSLPTVQNGNFIVKDKGTQTTFTLPSTYTRPSGWTSDDTGCFDTDTNYETDQTQMTNLNIWTTGEYYWLASRKVDYLGMPYCFFCMRKVYSSGGLGDSKWLCQVQETGYNKGGSDTFGLRPCFSLRSDINITGGAGTSEAPYTM